jgi:hypothetical protein
MVFRVAEQIDGLGSRRDHGKTGMALNLVRFSNQNVEAKSENERKYASIKDLENAKRIPLFRIITKT